MFAQKTFLTNTSEHERKKIIGMIFSLDCAN